MHGHDRRRMRGVKSRMRRGGLVAAAAVGMLVAAGSAQAATPPTLTDEFLEMNEGFTGGPAFGTLDVVGNCNDDGTGSFDFTADGTATGPYPGTFHEVGHLALPQPAREARPVSDYHTTFTIDSGDAHITGTMTMTTPFTGNCLYQPGLQFVTGGAVVSYQARIETPGGVYFDHGDGGGSVSFEDDGPVKHVRDSFHSALTRTQGSDTTPPQVSSPNSGATYQLGKQVLADFTCTDEPGGSGLASCVGSVPLGTPLDTSSVGPNSYTVNASDNDGNETSQPVDYQVIYPFSGFFAPVNNLPTVNVAKAGSAIPVKFSLGGDRGLAVLADGSPGSHAIACDSTAAEDAIEETPTVGPGLSYDAAAGQYVYVWKTDSAWAGTCRQLVVTLADGTSHRANVRFK